MFKLGPWELTAILLAVFIIFGAGKLPEVLKSLGSGLRSLRKGLSSDEDEKEGNSNKK